MINIWPQGLALIISLQSTGSIGTWGYYSRVPKDNSSYKILGANKMYCGRYANRELTVKLYSAYHLHITKPSIIITWVIKVINISLLLQCFLFCFRFWKKNNNNYKKDADESTLLTQGTHHKILGKVFFSRIQRVTDKLKNLPSDTVNFSRIILTELQRIAFTSSDCCLFLSFLSSLFSLLVWSMTHNIKVRSGDTGRNNCFPYSKYVK